MRRGLSSLLAALGGVALLTGGHDVLRGVPGVKGLAQGAVDASVDSELRFFAAWYAVAGVLMLRAARAPEREGATVRLLSAGWLLAALGRVLSLRAAGRPHALYRSLMGAEFAITGVLIPWQRAVEQLARSQPRRPDPPGNARSVPAGRTARRGPWWPARRAAPPAAR